MNELNTTTAPSKTTQMYLASDSTHRRVVQQAEGKQTMVVRNPAPDASPPVRQNEYKVFSLSY